MADITKTTQLSLYDLIKAQLVANSVLSGKFNDASYYRFEPSLKAFSFSQLPIIVIRTPTTSSEFLVLNHSNNLKSFSASILLLVYFSAREKFDSYANAIIAQMEGAESSFESSGYFNLECDLLDVGEDLIQDRKVVSGTFEVRCTGGVSR